MMQQKLASRWALDFSIDDDDDDDYVETIKEKLDDNRKEYDIHQTNCSKPTS